MLGKSDHEISKRFAHRRYGKRRGQKRTAIAHALHDRLRQVADKPAGRCCEIHDGLEVKRLQGRRFQQRKKRSPHHFPIQAKRVRTVGVTLDQSIANLMIVDHENSSRDTFDRSFANGHLNGSPLRNVERKVLRGLVERLNFPGALKNRMNRGQRPTRSQICCPGKGPIIALRLCTKGAIACRKGLHHRLEVVAFVRRCEAIVTLASARRTLRSQPYHVARFFLPSTTRRSNRPLPSCTRPVPSSLRSPHLGWIGQSP